jgi:mono/diheme cytochrome c family protein
MPAANRDFKRTLGVAFAAWLAVCCLAKIQADEAPQPEGLGPAPAAVAHTPSAAAQSTPATDKNSATVEPVNFTVDIAPIFAMRCIKCHGPEKRSGGLRLDAFNFAEAGGDSAKPIIGGTLETNELWARVSSSDRSYRMPKNAPPLSEEDLTRIKRWVSEGTAWTTRAAGAQGSLDKPFYGDWLFRAGDFADRYKFELDYATPYAVAFVALQLLLLVVARSKTAYRRGRSWTTGKAARFCKLCGETKTRELVLVWLLLVAAGGLVVMRGHDIRLAADLATSQMQLAKVERPSSRTVFGWPLKPVRPNHARRVAGTYYRGNCERNPELFNGGNYLTAIFRISLCDARHEAVQVGSPAPAEGLFVKMELERAPGTTETLFSKQLMASVFLSEQFLHVDTTKLDKPVARLETLEEAQRWVAYVPIGSPDATGKLGGLIYVYTGRIDDEMLRGDAHYGIQYDLVFDGGRLTAQSDLWMSSFGNSSVALPDPSGMIPFHEWFDYRPMPVIEGENSKDPKLLGVDEYVKKGLIAPQPSPPSDQSPKEKADQREE